MFAIFAILLMAMIALVPLVPHGRAISIPGQVTFVSNNSWQVFDSDPALGSATLLGAAQYVCLNPTAPLNCPPGATIYGHATGGWTADLSSIPGAHWIWAPNINGTTSPAEFNQFFFSKSFQISAKTFGFIFISADDFAEVRVNGQIVGSIGSISDYYIATLAQAALTTFDLSPFLKLGSNIITIRAENGPFGMCCPSNYAGNPAGVVFGGIFRTPSIQISPNQGPVGTKVLVQGSGFVSSQIEVTFENAFLGTTTSTNGTFSFTFNVPLSQPGLQHVEAVDLFSGVTAVANFTVTQISTLSLNVDVGTLYFPGDSANIYTLATAGGSPLNATAIQLQVTVTKPDGSTVKLNNTFIGGGLFKSTLSISKTGPTGTYAVLARAHLAGAQDASALAAFEVKPTWLSTQGPAIATTGAALTGIAAVGAVLWRRGIFKSKNAAYSRFDFNSRFLSSAFAASMKSFSLRPLTE